MVPVLSTTYISSGGQPDVIYESTHCWSSGQLRVKPMNRGVFSGTCQVGGLFHDGTLGRELVVKSSRRGKLSLIGGRTFTLPLSLYLGVGGFSGPDEDCAGFRADENREGTP